MDTIEGGKWLPDQDLAWTLVTKAVERVHELENELGCFFDRNPDGTLHQKAFAGQTFDRTVHKGDLTGIEIINRLAEQVWVRGRGAARGASRGRAGEDRRRRRDRRRADDRHAHGRLRASCRRGAVLLATGGGPTMYRYHTPSGDKSCDGLAMALRAGLALRDMEMVQFHPTGLLAGTRHAHDRHRARRRPARRGRLPPERRAASASCSATTRASSAPRATSSRARSTPRCAPAAARPNGGVYIAHGAPRAARTWRRSSRAWWSAAPIAASTSRAVGSRSCPTAHYMMGGVEFDADCRTAARGPVRRGRGHGRRARRESARRQRRGQLDRVRRDRRATRWRRGCARRRLARAGRRRSRPDGRMRGAPLGRPAGDLERSARRCTTRCGTTSGSCAMPRAWRARADRLDELRARARCAPAWPAPTCATISPGTTGSTSTACSP